jgi:hypothetical protein
VHDGYRTANNEDLGNKDLEIVSPNSKHLSSCVLNSRNSIRRAHNALCTLPDSQDLVVTFLQFTRGKCRCSLDEASIGYPIPSAMTSK